MKKIFLFCAALMAAVSVNAEIKNMNCAEAKAEALDKLQAGETGTDSVAVTGFVTKTDGTISRGQQTFWMDDEQGTTQTFQAYWCNIPGASGSNGEPLNVGDKVIIKGFLMNYQGTTAEMKNGDVVILERVTVEIDTIEVDVCEAIAEGEALNNNEVTPDVFAVVGVVSQVDGIYEQYNQATFWMNCEEEGNAANGKKFEAYYVTLQENDGYMPNIGDTVGVLGKIKKFNETIEIANGKAWILAKSNFVPDTIRVSVADAIVAGNALADNESTKDIYVVTGFCDSIAYAYDETKGNMSFYMCDDINTPTYDFEAYRVRTNVAIAVGEQVSVVGHIKKFVNSDKVVTIEVVDGYIEGQSTGLFNLKGDNIKVEKILENGQLFIIREGIRYNVLGALVK